MKKARRVISLDKVMETSNRAAAVALNMIFDFSGRYKKREEYQPVEKLAQEVAGVICRVFCEMANEKDTN